MHIYIIGNRGTGKSSTGRALAQLMNRPFHDADAVLEADAGMTIAQIFAEYGESDFRDRETDILEALSEGPDAVIATGGGVVLREENREGLRATGFVVWLKASAETLWERIQADTTTEQRRPNLTASGGLAEVQQMLQMREPYYQSTTHFEIDTEALSPEALAANIFTAWNSYLKSR